ncbi:MAG TPA: CpaD family pilus assembly lipoprotein [Stellaceae bacterium]|nr:CpaD family pilus assembly lipoprotein [Stellaceae bacterium]
MTRHLHLLAFALALAACAPGAAEYTKSEAPDRLQVQGSTSAVELAFAPGSARLAPSAASRLDSLVANGAIRPADRVAVAAAGPPALAAARDAVIASRLLRWGIVADARPLTAVPPNRAILTVGRYAVTLPPCPNWSMPRPNDFTNAPPSNFGCAVAVNLGLMAASPADLVAGRQLAPADGKPAAAAVDRYLNDKVEPLAGEASLGPIQGGSGGGAPGASGGAGSQ